MLLGNFATFVLVEPLTRAPLFVPAHGPLAGQLVRLIRFLLGFGVAIARQLHFVFSKGMTLPCVIFPLCLLTLMHSLLPAFAIGARESSPAAVLLLG